VRDRSHIGIAFLVNFLSPRLRLVLALATNALVLFFPRERRLLGLARGAAAMGTSRPRRSSCRPV